MTVPVPSANSGIQGYLRPLAASSTTQRESHPSSGCSSVDINIPSTGSKIVPESEQGLAPLITDSTKRSIAGSLRNASDGDVDEDTRRCEMASEMNGLLLFASS